MGCLADSLRVPSVNLSSNGIAQQLTTESVLRLQEIGTVVELAAGELLEPKEGQERPVFFLLDAVVSLWIEPETTGPRLALSLVGSEGMTGCSHLWPSAHPYWVSRVLKPGRAWQVDANQLNALFLNMPDLTNAVCKFLWSQTLEIAQWSARMQLADIHAQLALWLHLLQQKTGCQTLQITQQALADMMGTRRVSVTLAAGELQSEGIVSLRRGKIQIDNLQALAKAAGLAD
jgi:hypothetical protein